MSLGNEDFIVPEEPLEQERFKRQLIATARSLKRSSSSFKLIKTCSTIDGPMSWQPRNTAFNAQPKVTRSANCYLSSMTRRRSPYHHRTVRLTDHHTVGIKLQPEPKTRLSHSAVKAGIRQLGAIHMTSAKNWTVEQSTQDRSTDREDVT